MKWWRRNGDEMAQFLNRRVAKVMAMCVRRQRCKGYGSGSFTEIGGNGGKRSGVQAGNRAVRHEMMECTEPLLRAFRELSCSYSKLSKVFQKYSLLAGLPFLGRHQSNQSDQGIKKGIQVNGAEKGKGKQRDHLVFGPRQ